MKFLTVGKVDSAYECEVASAYEYVRFGSDSSNLVACKVCLKMIFTGVSEGFGVFAAFAASTARAYAAEPFSSQVRSTCL